MPTPPHLSPLGVEIIGALARFWAGGGGPSHASVSSALALGGYEEPEEAGDLNKEQRVQSALRDAPPGAGRRVAIELVTLLRSAGYLDSFEGPKAASLAAAMERNGHRMTEGGFVDWDVDLAPASVAAEPATPRGQSNSTLVSRSEEIAEVSVPTIGLLIDSLRRLPNAMRPLVVRQRDRDGLEIKDEYDVQDVVEALLRTLYWDVRPEERCPSYAGSSSTMDFLLKEDSVAIEVKVTRLGRGEKQVRNELLIDFDVYSSHPDVDALIAVVYDLHSTFRNPAGFEKDLSGTRDSVEVSVVVVGWPLPPR